MAGKVKIPAYIAAVGTAAATYVGTYAVDPGDNIEDQIKDAFKDEQVLDNSEVDPITVIEDTTDDISLSLATHGKALVKTLDICDSAGKKVDKLQLILDQGIKQAKEKTRTIIEKVPTKCGFLDRIRNTDPAGDYIRDNINVVLSRHPSSCVNSLQINAAPTQGDIVAAVASAVGCVSSEATRRNQSFPEILRELKSIRDGNQDSNGFFKDLF